MLETSDNDNALHNNTAIKYMSISLGDVNLLAKQSEIISIASIKDIDLEMPSNRSIGWIYFDNHKIPVYCLTERLDIELSISNNKNICVVLKDDNTYISLMCVEATSFKNQVVKSYLLPECMQAATSPVDSLCLYKVVNNNYISFIISAKSMSRYI